MNQAQRVIRFIETFCTLGGSFAGQPFTLLDYQKQLIADIYRSDGDRRLRRKYLVGLARKQGKSSLAAALALYHLVADPADANPLVISAAGDRQQARIVFDEAVRMVRANPELSSHLEVYRHHIFNPDNGGTYRAVSADAGLQQGLNPSFVVLDELHVFKDSELIDALTQGSAMRNQPLFLMISTAGYDLSSPLGKLYSYGLRVDGHILNGRRCSGEIDDPAFGMSWWGPEPGEEFDYRDPQTWRKYCPAHEIMPNFIDYYDSVLSTTHPNSFIRYQLNGWVSAENSWLPNGAWAKVENADRKLRTGEPIVIGFDGAWRGDCTAIVACALADYHLEVLGFWEQPPNQPDWHTPVVEVEDTIRKACRAYDVREIAADPYRFEQSLAALLEEGLPIVEFPTNSIQRMVPACQAFYEAVVSEDLSHSGHPGLARHLANAVVKEDSRGLRITKEYKSSSKHIDLAVAAVVAHHRARLYREPEPVPVKPEPKLMIL